MNKNLSKVSRVVLTDSVAVLALFIGGFIARQHTHIPLPIIFVQILAIELVLVLPITALSHDKKSKHHSRPHMHIQAEVIAFGLLGALLAYAGYLLFYALHDLSPVYIDTSSNLYAQATTLACVTLVLCQTMNLFLTRADEHQDFFTPHLSNNKQLLQRCGIAFFVLLNLVYNPLLQAAFSTESIGIVQWLTAVVCAGAYTCLRLLQRHTRQHSRHSVLKLHREVHK